MTIDERLEALVGRHEALAQSVELLTHDIHELKGLSREMMLAITRLANTAHAQNGQLADHAERIEKLEDR